MLRKVATASLVGVDAAFITVETDMQMGLPAVNLVGLADTTIKEAKERIRAAIMNSGYEFPRRRITVNLSPAGVPKEGSHFDLPIAVGILGLMENEMLLESIGFIGELSLDGSLKPVKGALPLAICLREEGIRQIVLPEGNAEEVSLLQDVDLYPAATLTQCVDFLKGMESIKVYRRKIGFVKAENPVLDYSDVLGQESAKRAMVIAAAGNHGVLMMGSPGSGKTMLAKRLKYIMPPMSYEEMLEVTKIYSAAGMIEKDLLGTTERPFRSPHHSISKAALVGGGALPKPGEISLAHNGILFLDEFGEFSTSVIELLRQPVEEGVIKIHRNRMTVDFPCNLMLVAAANPCKCGYRGDEYHMCTCTERQIEQYLSRFSGPVLDRIDLHIQVNVPKEPDRYSLKGLSTGEMREQVQSAVEMQKKRYQNSGILFNGRLQEAQIEEYCILEKDADEFLERAFIKLDLSLRTRGKLLKVARTIADLQRDEVIRMEHVAEALQYRQLDALYRR